MAHRFTVIFEKEEEGGYHVFCPTLPGCHTQSETIEEGIQNIREAIELYIESLLEDGLPVPEEAMSPGLAGQAFVATPRHALN